MPVHSPLTLLKHTSKEGLEVEALGRKAAELGKQGQVAAEVLQDARGALQNWAVQPQSVSQPGRLCQPAICLLLGHRQAEL